MSAASDSAQGQREARARAWGGSLSTVLLLAGICALALHLWLPGYLSAPLWVDELWRVNLILDPHILHQYLFEPSVYTAITAPVYVLLNRLDTLLFVSAGTLRLSSLIPGLLAIGVAYGIARKAGGGIVLGGLAAVLVATDQEFVRYVSQFKPYMLEVFIHLLCMFFWLDIIGRETRSSQRFTAFFAVLALALLSAANVVFILPALAVSVLVDAWRRPDREGLVAALVGFGALALGAGLMYLFVWSHGSDKDLLAYWAPGFYSAADGNYTGFLLHRFAGLWKGGFRPVGHGMAMVGIALAIAIGIGARLLFRWRETRSDARVVNAATFYVVFAVTTCTLNLLGLWPLGYLRPNLFLYAHLQVLLVLLLVTIPERRMQAGLALLLIAIAVLSALKVDRDHLQRYGAPLERSDLVAQDFADAGVIGKEIASNCANGPTTLLINGYMQMAFDYFSQYDTARKDTFGILRGPCVRRFVLPDARVSPGGVTRQLAEHAMPGHPTWLLYDHLSHDEADQLKTFAERFGSVSRERIFEGAGYFSLDVKSPGGADAGQADGRAGR